MSNYKFGVILPNEDFSDPLYLWASVVKVMALASASEEDPGLLAQG